MCVAAVPHTRACPCRHLFPSIHYHQPRRSADQVLALAPGAMLQTWCSRRARAGSVLLLALVGLLSSSSSLVARAAAQPLEVVVLTPGTFEHETQAASGQTTGHWCVLFTNSSSDAAASLQVAAGDAWEQLARDEDKATIMAKVDVAASGGAGLVKRFNFSALPAALLLRDRAMYVLDLASSAGEGGGAPAADADAIAGRVHAFVDGGYEQQVPHAVPREETLLDVIKQAANMMQVSPTPMLWAGIACLTLGLLIFMGLMGFGLWYMYSDDKPTPAAAAKKGAAAAAAKKKKDAAGPSSAAAAARGDADADADDDDDAEVVEASATQKPATRARRRA